MELWQPDQIVLSETSLALLGDVGDAARRLHDLRPLPPEVLHRVEEDLFGLRVYSSNRLEGNTLDLRETVMILQSGKLSGGRPREEREALNLGTVARQITQWLDDGVPCHDVDRLLEVHRVLLDGIDDQHAGCFRAGQVIIQGARHQPPDHTLVRPLVERVLHTLSNDNQTDGVLLATWAHWALARIHPFVDGNGRIARLWQDLVLCKAGLTCAIIRPEDRRDYLDALVQADEGDFNALVQLVANRTATTLELYERKLHEDEKVTRWVREVAEEADPRLAEQRKLDYQRWVRKMDQVRFEFKVCASRLNNASAELTIEVREYEVVDQARWEHLRAGLGAARTWFFSVDFSKPSARWRYYFFFGKHFWVDALDTQEDRSEPRVSLLVSEARGSGDATRLAEPEDSPVSLREVFVVDGRLVRKRVDRASSAFFYDRDIPPLEVAQDFIAEVIRFRLV